MNVVAEDLAHLLLPCRELTDNNPPRYSLMGADRLHRHTWDHDMAMAPRSGHVFATFPAVTQTNLHASVMHASSHWAFDEVRDMDDPRHMELRPYLFFWVLVCHHAWPCGAGMSVTAYMLLCFAVA